MKMREIMRIVEGPEADPIDVLIQAAEFDEDDMDIGTAGACGTFVMALFKFLRRKGISCTPALIVTTNKNGGPAYRTGFADDFSK